MTTVRTPRKPTSATTRRKAGRPVTKTPGSLVDSWYAAKGRLDKVMDEIVTIAEEMNGIRSQVQTRFEGVDLPFVSKLGVVGQQQQITTVINNTGSPAQFDEFENVATPVHARSPFIQRAIPGSGAASTPPDGSTFTIPTNSSIEEDTRGAVAQMADLMSRFN